MRKTAKLWDVNKNDPQKNEFQTPPEVASYMAKMIPAHASSVLEPTPGDGNILRAILEMSNTVTTYACTDYFSHFPVKENEFDCIVMNPPFSDKSANLHNAPEEVKNGGMKVGYFILKECMQRSKNVIALMPWFLVLDSDVRMRELLNYGLVSVTSLPRKTFNYTRIQTAIFQLQKGYKGKTEFKRFEF